VLVWTFPMYLNCFKAEELDAFWNSEVGLKKSKKKKVNEYKVTEFTNPFEQNQEEKRKGRKNKKERSDEEGEEVEEEEAGEGEEEEEGVETNARLGTAGRCENTDLQRVDEIQYVA